MLNEPLQHRTAAAAASGVSLHGSIPTVFPRLDPCTFWTLFHHKTLFVKAGFALCERQKIFIDFMYSAFVGGGCQKNIMYKSCTKSILVLVYRGTQTASRFVYAHLDSVYICLSEKER